MSYFSRRLLSIIPLLFVVTLLCFSMLKLLPGDPVLTILGNSSTDPAKVEALTKQLGLDRPFPVQYGKWLGNFATGDFGRTYNQGGGEPVRNAIFRDAPVTFELALVALFLGAGISVLLGMIGGYRSGTRLDRAIGFVNYALLSSPSFVIGPILIYFVALQWELLPVGQFVPWSDGIIDHVRSIILPAITLAVALIPNLSRILRTDMESTLKEDFITMAKSKGLSDRHILVHHALRPSSLTLITVAGINLGGLVSGAVIVERLFNLPGLGSLLISGIAQREYLLVLGVVTIITVVILLAATVVDLLYGVIDPRVSRRPVTRMNAAEGAVTLKVALAEPSKRKPWGIPFWIAVAWLVTLALASIFSPILPIRKIDDPDFLLGAAVGAGDWTSSFSKAHWLGVDDSGNDLLAYALKGARVSLIVGFGTVLLAFLVGGWAGMVAGYFRGRLDAILVFGTNAILSIPPLLFLLLLVSVLSASSGGVSLWKFIATLGSLSIPITFRVVRAATLQQASREYVVAARSMGAKTRRVLVREILPNVIKPALAYSLVAVGSVMVIEGGLSFLGAGLSGNTISWGKMLQVGAGLSKLKAAPNTTFVPAAFLFLTVLSLNFIGDKFRERLEVKQGNI